MNCTHCNKDLKVVLTEQQLQYKIRAITLNSNCNVFCSRSCSTSYNNLQKKTGKAKLGIRKKCKEDSCNNSISKHGRLFCKDCENKRKSAITYLTNPTKGELKYCNKSSPYSYIRWHAREIVAKNWLKVCCNCRYDKHVELAHIKSIASFSDEAKINEINASSNLLFLCPNCHWEFDKGSLKEKREWQDSNLH